MTDVKPRYLTWDEVREKAEDFRREHVGGEDVIPVPILEIVEIDLKIEPRTLPDLKRNFDIDGCISKDFKQIYVDENTYTNEKQERRLRFTYAHEVAHIILHQEDIINLELDTEEDWIKFRTGLPDEYHFWFEQQAYEFAGRLLVPKSKLVEELENNREKIERYKAQAKNIYNNEDVLIEGISRVLCDKFHVSDTVIFRRIKNEKVW